MVVAVGLILVEPLADVEVNVPGVMAIVVAPVAAQLSALLVPEFMVVGFAAKELTVGAEPFPEGELAPQPTSPTQANRMRKRSWRSGPEGLDPRELTLFLQNELVKFMRECFRESSPANSVYYPRHHGCSSPSL